MVDASFQASTRPEIGATVRRILRNYSFVFAALLTAVLLCFSLIREPNFGWQDQLANFAPIGLAAMASTPSIISGGGSFDLSISPLMILTTAVFIAVLVPAGLGGPEAIPILLLLGGAVGMLNGLMILVLRIPPVVVTLAMYFILIGVDLKVVPNSASLSGNNWTGSLAGSVGPMPGAVFTIGAPLLVWFLLNRIPYRRILYLIGSGGPAAFASGVNVGLVRVIAFSLGGMFAAIGGIALVALTASANANLATTYTLLALAAVALGGTSLSGGRGGLVGPLLGAASIYLLGNELTSLQVDPNYLQVIYGVLLIIAVTLSGIVGRPRRGAGE